MQKSEVKRCPTCKRSKTKAIREQVAEGKGCNVNPNYCYFKKEIKDALKRKNNIKIIKKKEKKVIKAIKKVKAKINILRK